VDKGTTTGYVALLALLLRLHRSGVEVEVKP